MRDGKFGVIHDGDSARHCPRSNRRRRGKSKCGTCSGTLPLMDNDVRFEWRFRRSFNTESAT